MFHNACDGLHDQNSRNLPAILMVLKVPRRLQLEFFSGDLELLFLCSYIICFVVFASELLFEVLAKFSHHVGIPTKGSSRQLGFFNAVVDFIVCCSLCVEISYHSLGEDHIVNFIGLRIFKVFKYLRVWGPFSDLDNILESVYDSMAMMANIFSALIVTLILYCIIAVQLFSDTFYSVCMNTTVDSALIPIQYCESSSFCPVGFDCVESPRNLPAMGTHAFDNSWNALIQLVQVVLTDNWPPVLPPSKFLSTPIYKSLSFCSSFMLQFSNFLCRRS
jgi:hypothetical protein